MINGFSEIFFFLNVQFENGFIFKKLGIRLNSTLFRVSSVYYYGLYCNAHACTWEKKKNHFPDFKHNKNDNRTP